MRIGVVMPHRGDRPEFLAQFHRIIERQTLQPYRLEIIDYPPKSGDVDITPRYREGYERMTDVDLVAFMEVDDYYRHDYLEKMAGLWKRSEKPELMGLSYTIYYHIRLKRYFRFEHYNRSSMMSTFIKPGLDVSWPRDIDPYTDLWLWKKCPKWWKKKVCQPKENLCIGIKHGVGMTGGLYHKTHLSKYNIDDSDLRLLKSMMNEDDLDFYLNLTLPDFPKA